MNIVETRGLLEQLADANSVGNSTVVVKDQVVILRMWSTLDTARWAAVASPGDGWFALTLDGGFESLELHEDASDADVSRYLNRYVMFASSYLRDGAEEYRTKVLRLTRKRLNAGGESLDVSMTTRMAMQNLLSRLR